jgi:hypothetical protein
MPRKSRIRRTVRRRKIRGGEVTEKQIDKIIKAMFSAVDEYNSTNSIKESIEIINNIPGITTYESGDFANVDKWFKGLGDIEIEPTLRNIMLARKFIYLKRIADDSIDDGNVIQFYISFKLLLHSLNVLIDKNQMHRINDDELSKMLELLTYFYGLLEAINLKLGLDYTTLSNLIEEILRKINDEIDSRRHQKTVVSAVTPDSEGHSNEGEYADDFEEEENKEYPDDFESGGGTRRGTRTAKPKRGKKRKQTKKRNILRQRR